MSRRKRIAALEALRQPDYEPLPDMQPWIDAAMATCDAHESGRPYSHWSNPLRPPQPEPDPMSPGGQLLQRALELRRRMEAESEWAEEEAERAKRKAATIRAIEREGAARSVAGGQR